jgi:hypothetical protein
MELTENLLKAHELHTSKDPDCRSGLVSIYFDYKPDTDVFNIVSTDGHTLLLSKDFDIDEINLTLKKAYGVTIKDKKSFCLYPNKKTRNGLDKSIIEHDEYCEYERVLPDEASQVPAKDKEYVFSFEAIERVKKTFRFIGCKLNMYVPDYTTKGQRHDQYIGPFCKEIENILILTMSLRLRDD